MLLSQLTAADQYYAGNIDKCRCEYPSEDVYGPEYNTGLLGGEPDDLIIQDGVLIAPSWHELCADIRFVCAAPNDDRPPTNYKCSAFFERRFRQQRNQRKLRETMYDQVFLEDPSTSPYMILPPDHVFCGGKVAPTCRDKTIDFERGGDDRTLRAGDFVRNDWKFTHGLTITAKNELTEAPLVPKIFDSSNPGAITSLGSPNKDCNSFGRGDGPGGMVGALGQNCESHGNILIASKSNPLAAAETGILTFSFDEPVETMDGIGVLNAMDGAVEVIQSNGAQYFVRISDMGRNGYQMIPINMDNVVELSVYLSANAAVTELNFCSS